MLCSAQIEIAAFLPFRNCRFLVITSFYTRRSIVGGLLNMSHKELDRYSVLQRVLAKDLTQQEAANLLSLKERQIRYLLTHIKKKGAEGLISKHRGKKGNHRKPDAFRQHVLALAKEQYEG